MNTNAKKLRITNKNIKTSNYNENIILKRIKNTNLLNSLLNRKLNNHTCLENKKNKINEFSNNKKFHINDITELENGKINDDIPSNREIFPNKKKFSRRTIIIDKPSEDSNISKVLLLHTLSQKTNKSNKNDKSISTTNTNNISDRNCKIINYGSCVINSIKNIQYNKNKIKQKHTNLKCNVFFNNLQRNNNIKSIRHNLSENKRKKSHKRNVSMENLKFKSKELLNNEDLIRAIKTKNLEYFSNSFLKQNKSNTNTYNNYYSVLGKKLDDPVANINDICNIEKKWIKKIDINKKIFVQNKKRKSSDLDSYNFETNSEIEEKLNKEKYIIIIQAYFRGYLGRKFIRCEQFLIFLEKYVKRFCFNKIETKENNKKEKYKKLKNKIKERKYKKMENKKGGKYLWTKENICDENENNDSVMNLENKFEKMAEENQRLKEEFEIMKKYIKKFDNIILEQNKQNNNNKKNNNTEKNRNICLKNNFKIEKSVINIDFAQSPTKNNDYSNTFQEKYKLKIMKNLITKKIFKEKQNIQKFFDKFYYLTKCSTNNNRPSSLIRKSCLRHNNSICIPNEAKNKVYFLMNNNDDKNTPEELQQIKKTKILRNLVNKKITEQKECIRICFRNFYFRGVLTQMKKDSSTRNLPQINPPKEVNDDLYENISISGASNNENEETTIKHPPQELRLSLMKQNKEYEERIKNLNKARGLRRLLSKKNKEKIEILRKYFSKFEEAILICTIKRETRRKTVFEKLVNSKEFQGINENEIKEIVQQTEFRRGESVSDFQRLVSKIIEEKQMKKKEEKSKVEKEKKNEEIKNDKIKYLQKFVNQIDRQNKIKLKKAFDVYYLKSRVLSLAALPSVQQNIQKKVTRRKSRRKTVQVDSEKIHKLIEENIGMDENENDKKS